jgi:hypothetical protein
MDLGFRAAGDILFLCFEILMWGEGKKNGVLARWAKYWR